MKWTLVVAAACGSRSMPREDTPRAVRREDAPRASRHDAAQHATEEVPCSALPAAPVKRPDLDGDGVPDAVIRKLCGVGRCDYAIYRAAGDCFVSLGGVEALGGAPVCDDAPPHGTPCTLTGTRPLMHGDVVRMVFRFDGRRYSSGRFGSAVIRGPRKK